MPQNEEHDDLLNEDVGAGEAYDDDLDAHSSDEQLGEDEEWDDPDGEDSGEANDEPPQKKKSSLSNLAIIGGAVVAGLAFLFFHFSGSSQPTGAPGGQTAEIPQTSSASQAPMTAPADPTAAASTTSPAAPIEAKAEDTPATPTTPALVPANGAPTPSTSDGTEVKTPGDMTTQDQATAQGDAAKQGFMNNAKELPQAAPVAANPANAPTQPAPSQSGAPMTNPAAPAPDTLAPAPAGQAAPPLANPLKPVSDFPTVEAIKKNDTPVSGSVTPEAKPQGGSDFAVAGGEQELKHIEAPTPALQKTDAGKPAVVAAPVPTVPLVASPDALGKEALNKTEAADLKDQLAKAMARIDALEKKAQSSPSSVAGKSASNSDIAALRTAIDRLQSKVDNLSGGATPMVKSATQEPDVVETEPVIKHHHTPKKEVVHKAASKGMASTSQKKSESWELRGAQPDQALIADKSTGDLRVVRVGETVKGLGRITAIEQDSKGWVVTGTTGKVHQ